jgi:hypothetical protein
MIQFLELQGQKTLTESEAVGCGGEKEKWVPEKKPQE